MTRVRYERHGDGYRLCELHADGETRCVLSFSPPINGRLLIGDRTIPVRQGEATLSLSPLSDGCYTPCLTTAEGVQLLPPLRKEGRMLLTAESEEYTEALLRETAAQRQALQRLSERVTALEQAVNGTSLFHL